MKTICLASLVVAALAGCDYTVRLVDEPSVAIDPAAYGLWQRTDSGGGRERLLLLPLGKTECLVSIPAGTSDALFARACLWREADMTLVQLEWLGTGQGELPEDARVFQYAAMTLSADTLVLRLLNPEMVSREIATSEALAKAIVDNGEQAKLFRGEMVYRRVEKDRDADGE